MKTRLIGGVKQTYAFLPIKPKWMRWHTYERLAEKYYTQEDKIDQIIADYVG